MIEGKRNYYRLYLAQDLGIGTTIPLAEQDRHYLQNVIRIKAGSHIKVFNENSGEFIAKVVFQGKLAEAFIEKHLRKSDDSKYLHLGVCLVKNAIMPDIIDQAVQLGVTHITPLISAHTNNREFNLERYKKIAKEALEQSNRLDLAQVLPPMSLENFIAQEFDLIIFANEREKENNLLSVKTWPKKLALLVGPEGGFSESEIAYLSTKACSITLNKNILKVTAACVALLAQISLLRD